MSRDVSPSKVRVSFETHGMKGTEESDGDIVEKEKKRKGEEEEGKRKGEDRRKKKKEEEGKKRKKRE